MCGIYWLASYPKSGNTWIRSFLSNLQKDGAQPVDINALESDAIASSRLWLDEVLGFDTADLDADEVDHLRRDVYRWSLQDGRIGYHKIHDAYTVLSDGTPLVGREATLGALYIVRNPLDVVASAANHWHLSLDLAIERLGKPDMALAHSRKSHTDQVRQRVLCWSEHVLSWADAPDLNVHLVRYEDMQAEPLSTFTGVARFLKLPDDADRVKRALGFSHFNVLSQQEAAAGFRERPYAAERFFRRGRTGGWREELTAKQVERVIKDHATVMRRFGYLDDAGKPL